MTVLAETDTDTVTRIRATFPALARRHCGHPVAYLDGPGGTQVPQPVVDAMASYLLHHNANTHWNYPTSEETDQLLEQARQAFADLLNADGAEVVFGPNMTTLAFHLSRGLGCGYGAGDEIVVTDLDHHANIAPWQALARERGVVLRRVPFLPETGGLDFEAMERAIGRRTRLVAVGWASNALGTVNDVARVVALARSAGATTFLDAVHAVPHRLPDVRALGCDYLACSPYKFYGPHLGVLYGRRELLESLDIPRLEPAPHTAPERLELGTQCHEGIVGAAAAVDFIAGIRGRPGMARREALKASYDWLDRRAERQVERLWSGLAGVRGVTLYGPSPGSPRTPTISFTTPMPSGTVARRLAEHGVFVSHGDFYAATVVERLGVEGLVRIGCACYTEGEIDQVIEALATVLR
jgi:cysteine desulfurase family protein (TIGR01976 family)